MFTIRPIAFLSYVHSDDANDSGYLSELRNRLCAEVQAQTGNEFPIFQDRDGIEWGQNWKTRIQESLDNATFLIPIITPSFFKSESCRDELKRFLEREKKLGRCDLILPIYYIESKLDDKLATSADELAGIVASHQYVDWRNLRAKPFKNAGVSNQIRRMANQIRKAIERISIAEKSPIEYSEEDVSIYLKFIIGQCARLDPRGLLRGSKTHDVILPLEDVFVTLKAGPNNPWEREAEQNLLDSDVEEQLKRLGLTIIDNVQFETAVYDFRYANLAREAHMLIERKTRGGESINFDQVFQEHRWLAILGDPGSGKTTLLHWLSLQFAKAFLDKKERVTVSSEYLGRENGDEEIDLGPVRFPVLVRIADYSKARRENSSLTIFDYLGYQPILGQYAPIPQETASAISRDYVRRGKAILLLDGLDEITDSADRRKIRDEIERFTEDYVKDPRREQPFGPSAVLAGSNDLDSRRWWALPNLSSPVTIGDNQIVITSRIAGYKNAVLRGEITHYLIEPLDDKSVERFCRRWTLAVERYLAFQSGITDIQIEEKASQEAESLIEEVFRGKGVRKLATNPLLLTILALLHREQSHLPSHRIELYRQATQALIERRETTLTEPQVIDILGPFALWLLENEPTGLATEAELRDQISTGMRRWLGIGPCEELPGKFILEIENFINTAREQTGLLVARGEGLYGFMHLTFLEYFVARELTRTSSKVKENILRYLHRPRWQESLLLAIANVSAVQRGDLADLMKSLLDAKSEHEDILHRNLLFASSCVADTVWMPPEILRRIISELMALYADKTGRGRYKALRKQLIEAFENIYRPDTTEIIEGIFKNFLKGNAPRFRAIAGEILSEVTWGASELLTASIDALELPGIPDKIIDGINGLIKRGTNPSEEVGEFTLTTLQRLYSEDAQIKSAIDLLRAKTPEESSFLETYGDKVNLIVIPTIANLLKNYDPSTSEEFISTFWSQLRKTLVSIVNSSAGFGYTSALTALANLDADLEFVLDTIRENIAKGKNREESIDLYLTSFSTSWGDSFGSWWESLALETKKQFFETAMEGGKEHILEKQAWTELGGPVKELEILALKLLTSLQSIALSRDRLDLLESLISMPDDEYVQIAGDILERASLPEDPELLAQIHDKLEEWLASESHILRSFGAILLAYSDRISEDTYQGLIETLRSSDDRLRQFADHVMHKRRPASGLSPNVIDQAVEAVWYEDQERHDGLATFSHQSFIRSIFHDIPGYIQDWVNRLAGNVSPQEKDIIQCGLGNVELCAPNVLNFLLELINQTEAKPALESMLASLLLIARRKLINGSPKNIIDCLSGIVLRNEDDEIRSLASKIIGCFGSQDGYDILSGFLNSNLKVVKLAGMEGLGSTILYGPNWRSEILDKSFELLQSNSCLVDQKLHRCLAKTWIRAILLSEPDTSNVLDKILENIKSDELCICLESGEGDDYWDEALCNDGTGFHSKLVDVIRLMVVKRPALLEDLARYVLDMLRLPKVDWVKKRVPLGALSACSQELPANLAQLALVKDMEYRLLEAATDPNSFSMRRFSIVTLCQLRRVSPRILEVLAAGCRDLGIVQNAVFQAIRSLRLIDIEAIPQLTQLLSSPSTATEYVAAMIIREIGSSSQAVEQYGLLTSIANGLANCIRNTTFSRHVYIDDRLVGELDDIIFTTLVRVTADNPQEIYLEEAIAESRLALTSLREIGTLGQPGDLRNLQEQAEKMQRMLQGENIVLQEPGIMISMSGDQKFQRVELDGVNDEGLVEALNEAVKQTQEIAAKKLIEISSNPLDAITPDEENQDTPPELLKLQTQAQRMQSSLQQEQIEVEGKDAKVIIRGDQLFLGIDMRGKENAGLLIALNKIIKRSQELAARKLIEISGLESIVGDQENEQDDQYSISDE